MSSSVSTGTFVVEHGPATGQQLLFPEALLQPLPAAPQRLEDGLRRAGEPALKDGQGEADGPLPALLELVGAVELLSDVLGDVLVELGLGVREPVGRRVGPALREEARAVEAEHLLLHEAPHHVARVDHVDAVAELALEAVAVEERHEELEVLFLAVVGRRGHQEEVSRQAARELAELVALRLLHLAREEGGRHLVRLVHDHEVPVAAGLELGLHVLVAAELVEAGDDEVVLVEPVAGAGRLELVVGQDLERELELVVELVLPLLGEAPGTDDEAALEIASRHQLLDEEAGHDRLAGAGVVGQQEAQRLAGQHLLVDGHDLVRQRLDEAGVDGQERVEEVGEADAVGLADEAEEVRRRRRSSRRGPSSGLRAGARPFGTAARCRACPGRP